MKLKNIFYTLGMSLLLTACSESFDDWAAPQSNPQEDGITVNVDIQSVDPIDFATLEGEDTQVFSVSYTIPEDAGTTTEVYFYNADRTDSVMVEASADGNVGTEDFRSAIERLYGKRPVQRDVPMMVITRVNTNGQTLKLKGETNVLVTLTAPLIESAYYLIGAHNSWSMDTYTQYKLTRADESVDVYDDPVWTITVPAPVDGQGLRADFWFNIVPQSVVGNSGDDFWHGLIGSDQGNGDNRLEAGLAYKVDGKDNAFCQPASDGAQFYKITLNMMDYKMTVTPLSFGEYIYVPGNPKWDPGSAAALRSPNFDGYYEGFAYLDGDFKFTKARDWSAEYNFFDFTSFSDGFSQGGGSNINMATTGFYFIQANIPAGSLTATKTDWGIVGPAQAGGWGADTDMTYDTNEDCWTATLDLTADLFKFRANDDWGINMGGSADDLYQDGGDLSVPEAGTYTIKLYLSRTTSEKFYCTITRQQ